MATINNIVKQLQEMQVDGETMQVIIEKLGMDDQMLRQLVLTKPTEMTVELLEEKETLYPYPSWIGVELPHHNGNVKVCIGINQEDGHEVSFCNQADIEQSPSDPWNFDGDLVVKYGKDERVFDDNHKLNK